MDQRPRQVRHGTRIPRIHVHGGDGALPGRRRLGARRDALSQDDPSLLHVQGEEDGACNYVPKLFADEAQAKRWIDDDVTEFLRFLKEKSCPDYRIIHDYDEPGLWTPEGDHNIPSRSVWFADIGSADRCSVDFLERSAMFWTIVRYSWSEVEYESEMLKRAAGVMPEHVSDDPRW